MSVCIAITHAAFSLERRVALNRLMGRLRTEAPDVRVVVACDKDRQGSLWCWRQAMEMGIASGASHVCWLPDDAIVCDDFGRILTAAIKARPRDVFDCFVNHPAAMEIPTAWYTTPDGYVGVGGVMPVDLLREHLAWRDSHAELGDYPNDAGVNLWAIVTGRLIYKTACSLVTHDTTIPSLDGHDEQGKGDSIERVGMKPVALFRQGVRADVMNFLGRTFMHPDLTVASAATPLGPTYKGQVWDVARVLEMRPGYVTGMYAAASGPVENAHVMVVTPVYGEPAAIMMKTDPSRLEVERDLVEHGVAVSMVHSPGESLVCRMRQRMVHQFLKSDASHLLFWDADIECLTPNCVRAMLMSGHDVVAGACPFKDTTRRVVCNPLPGTFDGDTLTIDKGCLEVLDAGTGFMLISRKALLALMEAHPELMHFSRSKGDTGEPLWALFDTGVEDGVYLSEDYRFCRLWQRLGGHVYVYVPAKFRHWGYHGFEASFVEQYGLERAV